MVIDGTGAQAGSTCCRLPNMTLTDSGFCWLHLQTVQTELLPGGNSIPVTADNRLLYVYLLADYHLNTRLGRAAKAFAGEQ